MAVLHADQLNLDSRIGNTMTEAGISAFLTDTTVAAANTVDGLVAAVNAASVHADKQPMRARIVQAIRYGAADGSFTDALIAPLTTIAGLVALTQAGASANVGLLPD